MFAGAGLCFQRDLHHDHYPGLAADPSNVAQAYQFYPDLRHHVLTFVVTGPIVARYGGGAALQASNLLYVTVFVLCLLLGFVSRHRIHSQAVG